MPVILGCIVVIDEFSENILYLVTCFLTPFSGLYLWCEEPGTAEPTKQQKFPWETKCCLLPDLGEECVTSLFLWSVWIMDVVNYVSVDALGILALYFIDEKSYLRLANCEHESLYRYSEVLGVMYIRNQASGVFENGMWHCRKLRWHTL